MTATETSRQFSEVLNRVAAGEEIEITRSGAPVAVIAPPKVRSLTAEQFRNLLRNAPPVDEDFAADVRAARGHRAAGNRVALLVDTNLLIDLERDETAVTHLHPVRRRS